MGFNCCFLRFGMRSMCASLAVLLSACAPVPLDQPKAVTQAAIAPVSSELKQAAATITANGNPSQSALILLVEGNEALGARLRLIERAEHTLDLQYFLFKPDLAGALVAQALLDAADRGVRVRFLVDDIFTTVPDTSLGLLDVHPNIEVRVFNPVLRPGPKSLGLLAEFSRANRRMHNKLFVVDGAVAIIGGRNIADEYFQIQTDTDFADFELLAMGPVLTELEQAFDLFWNDGWAVPIASLRERPSAEELQSARAALTRALIPARDTYEAAVNAPHFTRLSTGEAPVFRARTRLVVDPPEKLKTPVRGGPRLVAEDLLTSITNATESVVLISPYFVPEDYGARLFADLARRGVEVRIITNSVGSTNHAYVHAGYRRHREDLLRAGVKLHEIRPDALQASGRLPRDNEIGLVMHTKLAVIDRDEVFIGSLNFDPRSIKLNTEIGVFAKGRDFAGFMHDEIERQLGTFTYRLTLSKSGALQWHYDFPKAPTVTDSEPGVTFWNSLVIGVTELLDIELQL